MPGCSRASRPAIASCSGLLEHAKSSAPSEVERVGRRIHAASPGAASSFVVVSAASLPLTRAALVETCERLIHAATGGTLLLTGVEEMPATVQDELMDILAEVQTTRGVLPAAKVMAGTTVFLRDRIAAGTFSERLFYRLNTIHVVTSPAAGSAIE
jgi:DNA-binding NtrC family response regulator